MYAAPRENKKVEDQIILLPSIILNHRIYLSNCTLINLKKIEAMCFIDSHLCNLILLPLAQVADQVTLLIELSYVQREGLGKY